MRKKTMNGMRKFLAVSFALFYLFPIASVNKAFAQNGDWDNLAPLGGGTDVNLSGDIQAVTGVSTTINVTTGTPTLNGNNGTGGRYTISGHKDNATGETAPQLINNSSGGLVIKNVNMIQGGGANGGAIGNTGTLTVENSSFSGNTTLQPGTGGGGANAGNGGAIHNNGGDVTVSNSTFTGNGVYTDGSGNIIYRDDDGNIATPANGGKPLVTINGGAIYNAATAPGSTSGTLIIQNNTKFDGNYASNGGAVYNAGKADIRDSSFTNNKALIPVKGSTDGNYGRGGAIFNNSGDLKITNTSFKGNNADINSGALYNGGGNVTIQGSTFEENRAQSTSASGAGGAIGNYRGGTINVGSTKFIKNYGSAGGAIYNSSLESVGGAYTKATVNVVNSEFKNNYGITSGGAIYTYGEADIKNSQFTGNGASADKTVVVGSGGAIYNAGNVSTGTAKPAGILKVANTNFNNNIADSGGAIANLGTATVENSNFEDNGYVHNRRTRGGAIINSNPLGTGSSSLSVQNSTFKNNVAQEGGAIYNESTATVSNSNFVNNGIAKDGTQKATSGGAIYNAGTLDIIDSSFSGNTASTGGALYGSSNSTTNIKADTRNVIFGTGAVAGPGGETDTVFIDSNAKANLLAKTDRAIVFNSSVSGQSANHGVVNVNPDAGYQGSVVFNAPVSNTDINLHNGTLQFTKDQHLDASDSLTLLGGTLHTMNGAVNTIQAGAINLNGNTNMAVDVDIANRTMDNILDGTSNLNYQSGSINISDMKSVTDFNGKDMKILFTDVASIIGNGKVTSNGISTIEGPIYKYAVKQMYDNGAMGSKSGEYFVFNNIGNSDNVLLAPVAAQLGGFLMMDNLYRQSFANMDMVMLMTKAQRQAMKFRNKYSSTDDVTSGLYQPSIIGEERDGLWVRPFANFESVPLSNGPKVSNVSYGALLGGDSDIIDLGHGWDGTFSLFGAYHGSHQAYNGIGIWQNGGSLGAVGVAYKGNFFTGLTANIGASSVDGHSEFGNEHFPMLMTGVASKSGYNFEFANGKFILQPSYMMSYTFVNAFDYTNAAGVSITQDPLNVIEIIPGIKLIANLKGGWQPYLGVNMTWNIMNKTKFYANDVALDRLSVDPFVEYGVGLQKRMGDRFTGFGQAMMRNGGRNGIALTMGWRWALGD